jgi:predicted porin
MRRKFMDKKILLSGAAALIMGFGFATAPAQASAISLSTGGEGTLSVLMSDHCNFNTADLDDNASFSNVANGATDQKTACEEENPVWSTESSFEWTASGTLANGLSVSVNDTAVISLAGAFGSVTFEKDGDSAVKAARVGADGDIDLVGMTLGQLHNATSGTAGMVVTYQAPSVGGMDLFVSYAPNSGGGDTVGNTFTDTIGVGATFGMDALTVSAGWETATNNGSANCTAALALSAAAAQSDLETQARTYGGDLCGDETVMAFGAEMAAGDLTIGAGYSTLDTEQGDETKLSVSLGMDVGDYAVSLAYADATRDYTTDVSDKQTVIGVGASTALGDGVDLGLSFSNNQINIAGTGAHTNYRAEAKVTVTY